MKFIIILLAILNLLDAFITHLGILGGHISEANPLMYTLYELNPFFFLFAKALLSIFLIALIFIIRFPVSKLIRSLSYVATALYTYVFFLHGYWITQIF
ncbi:DUF5658 family protein [Bacillus sp. REN16]|uniref:DUF5658 family protein n=1 Tax=Bacillus sp. REN16 TaxID=2887296 RepID=UPI001E3CE33D|nr:DUF5658 family protein [Bacillus sp. REN16]MCC3356758.1 DUF5658 family protein [Bacillus sp. REN16]